MSQGLIDSQTACGNELREKETWALDSFSSTMLCNFGLKCRLTMMVAWVEGCRLCETKSGQAISTTKLAIWLTVIYFHVAVRKTLNNQGTSRLGGCQRDSMNFWADQVLQFSLRKSLFPRNLGLFEKLRLAWASADPLQLTRKHYSAWSTRRTPSSARGCLFWLTRSQKNFLTYEPALSSAGPYA